MVTADLQQTKQFFQKRWLEARAVSDEEADIYKLFALERGGAKQMFGLRSIWRGVKATFKGHTVGAPEGDPWRLGGFFMVDRELNLLWSHPSQYAGDHANLDEVAAAFASLA